LAQSEVRAVACLSARTSDVNRFWSLAVYQRTFAVLAEDLSVASVWAS